MYVINRGASIDRYSQIKKEGLSIIFALNKFNQYLYGNNFTLVTGHKPFATTFHSEKGIPQYSANRLRRWAVILLNYRYKIEFVKSERDIAHCLSGLPLDSEESFAEDEDVDYLNYFSSNKDFSLKFSAD